MGQGLRVPAGVRKPLMQGPAIDTLWLWGFVFWRCQGVNGMSGVYQPCRVDIVACRLDFIAFRGVLVCACTTGSDRHSTRRTPPRWPPLF